MVRGEQVCERQTAVGTRCGYRRPGNGAATFVEQVERVADPEAIRFGPRVVVDAAAVLFTYTLTRPAATLSRRERGRSAALRHSRAKHLPPQQLAFRRAREAVGERATNVEPELPSTHHENVMTP